MNYLARLKNIFLDYSYLFSTVKNEKTIYSVFYYVFLTLILLVINWVILSFGQLPANLYLLKQLPLTEDILLYVPVYFFALNILGLFVFSIGAVFVSRILGAASSFSTNAKIFAHASTPFILTMWLPAFNVIFSLWTVYLTSKGFNETNNIELKKAFYIVIGAGVVTGIVSLFATYIVALNLGIDFDILRMFIRV